MDGDVNNLILFLTASFGLAVFLYQSQVQIELCHSMEHVLLIEQGIRGGWSGVSGLRIALANHPYLGPKFNPLERLCYPLDLDVVGLYAYCMLMAFAHKGFFDMDKETMDKLLFYLQTTGGKDIKTNSKIGFIIECDLEVDENFIGEEKKRERKRERKEEETQTYIMNI